MIFTILFPQNYNNKIELYISGVLEKSSIEKIYCCSQRELFERVKAFCLTRNIDVKYLQIDDNSVIDSVSDSLSDLAAKSDIVYIFSKPDVLISYKMIEICRFYNTEFLFIQRNDLI